MNKITKWLLLAVILGQSLVNAGPLHDAASANDLNKVKELLANGEAVDGRDDKTGFTALMWAAYMGHIAVVQELLKAGADIDAAQDLSGTALVLAVDKGHLAVVQELLRAGANANASADASSNTLKTAAENGYLPIVQELLRAGANVNAKTRVGMTVLGKAAGNGHRNVVKAIREWSIENQAPVTNPADIKILDGNEPGSYDRDFAAHRPYLNQTREAMKESDLSRIPRPDPTSIIDGYLGIPEEPQPKRPQPQKCPHCGY